MWKVKLQRKNNTRVMEMDCAKRTKKWERDGKGENMAVRLLGNSCPRACLISTNTWWSASTEKQL